MSEIGRAVLMLQDIIDHCSSYKTKLNKLKRRTEAELKFITSLDEDSPTAIQRVRCSNISHLRGIHSTFLTYQSSCDAVFRSFRFVRDNINFSLTVDLVLLTELEDLSKPGGICSWMKVISRNPYGLQSTFNGECSFGEKSIIHHAEEYLFCANANQHHYSTPNVIFFFTAGVTFDVKSHLHKMGVKVMGESVDADVSIISEISAPVPSVTSSVSPAAAVNLDVTTLIVMCSDLCHGNNDYDFGDHHLNRMAKEEKLTSALSIVKSFTFGKSLLVCQSARDQFANIVSTVAGFEERKRADELLGQVTVVPDRPSETVNGLRRSSRINDLNCIVFGTGNSLSAVTLTSNMGFVRAAISQGVRLAVHSHPARAFSEQKKPE